MSATGVTDATAQCTAVAYRFYALLDEGRFDELADLFAAEGEWVRLGQPLVGRDAIRAVANDRRGWLTAHIVTNVSPVMIDADHVESRHYVTLYRIEGWELATQGPAPVSLPTGVLRHHDLFVREHDKWKIARKTSQAVMVDRHKVGHYDR